MQNYTKARDRTKLRKPKDHFKFKPQTNNLRKQFFMGLIYFKAKSRRTGTKGNIYAKAHSKSTFLLRR